MRKVAATFDYENSLWQDIERVCGIDEVGRGAWAGPLVAAAVVFPKNYKSETTYFDSKLITPLEREKLAKRVEKEAVSIGIGLVEVSEIEILGLAEANQLAYLRALQKLACPPQHYLIDAFYVKSLDRVNQTPITHGDMLCSSIAAASIVAKVFRDNLMRSLPKAYSRYKFKFNKGYGTKAHQEAILKYGLSDLHRANYNLKILQ